jgi:hypothetical protein
MGHPLGSRGPLRPEQFGLVQAYERILAKARELKREAEAFGCLDEVAAIICPPIERKQGRQRGSHSPKLAARRTALWAAYESEMAKDPTALDSDIAKHLYSKGYGSSAETIAVQIAKLKTDRNRLQHFLARVGAGVTKRGRPKKQPVRRKLTANRF